MVGTHVVLNQRREQRLRDAQPYRACREIDIVGVLGARWIRLRTFIATEILQLVPGLTAQQILDGVIDRRRVWLDGNPVCGRKVWK